MTCLFCDNDSEFNTLEHIIPESLGNDDLLLEKQICDKCQNYLSQIENYVLNKTPIGYWRTIHTIKTKKNKLPTVNYDKSNANKGAIPDFHEQHDNYQMLAHEDSTTELKLDHSIFDHINKDGQGSLKYVITPKVIHEIGRLLGKIGLELICLNSPKDARTKEFDEIRKYVRHGLGKELWPIFHATFGDMKSQKSYGITQNINTREFELNETVHCYSYSLKRVERYLILNFIVGIDSWFICLNDMFPSPIITQAFPEQQMILIWYESDQWKK